MSGLGAIYVKVDGLHVHSAEYVLPFPQQIHHALNKRASRVEFATIDLSSLLLGSADRPRLFEWLGQLGARASADFLGPFHIRETAHPRTGLVGHFKSYSEESWLPSPGSHRPSRVRIWRNSQPYRAPGFPADALQGAFSH